MSKWEMLGRILSLVGATAVLLAGATIALHLVMRLVLFYWRIS